jgi:hypothetical protein
MRWLELARDCYACGTEQERGKEEVLGLFRSLFGTSCLACSTQHTTMQYRISVPT